MKDGIANINKPVGIPVPVIPAKQSISIFTNGIGYVVVCVVTTVLISFIFSIVIIPGITSIRSAVAPAVCFLFLGFFLTAFLFSKSNVTNSITYAFIVFAGVLASSMLIGFVKARGSVITNLFYSCLFALPYTIYQAWHFYSQLLFISRHKIWYMPQQASDMPKATVFLNSISIQIRMAPSYGAPEQVFEATVPGRLSVGMMFTDLIKNESGDSRQKETFEDISSQIFGWQFFVPSFLGVGKRLLDADISLDKNKIKNGTVVIAKRIQEQPTVLQITH